MNILLCTPYLNDKNIVLGGIGIWAQNLLKYRSEIESNVHIIPISFDRRNFIDTNIGTLKRIYLGWKELSVAVKLAKKEMKNSSIDAIHICTSASFSLLKDILLLHAAQKNGIKSIIHFHFGRIPQIMNQSNWENYLLRKVISIASEVITMDMKSYNILLKKGYKNITYCPNPLSSKIIHQISKEESSIHRQPNKLIFVGHVIPFKGVYELINACKLLENIELHIIGRIDSKIESDLMNIASEKDEGSWLKIRGEISHEFVIRELLSSSIFILPSYSEGFPNVVIEAMACGCPIIATQVGAIPEMLNTTNDACGICIPPRNTIELKTAIETLLHNDTLKQSMGIKAKQRVNNLYAIPKIWNQLTEIWTR